HNRQAARVRESPGSADEVQLRQGAGPATRSGPTAADALGCAAGRGGPPEARAVRAGTAQTASCTPARLRAARAPYLRASVAAARPARRRAGAPRRTADQSTAGRAPPGAG